MRKKLSRRFRDDTGDANANAEGNPPAANPDESSRLIENSQGSSSPSVPSQSGLPSFYENTNLSALQRPAPEENSGHSRIDIHDGENDEPDETSPRARQKAAVTKLGEEQQDIDGQEKRMKQLQTSLISSSWLCCPIFTDIIKAGYMLREFHRRGKFEENNQGLNLSALKHRYQLSVTIKSVQSYRNHIVGLVKPFVRVHIVDIDTGFHFKLPTYTPARPKYTHGLRIPDIPGALVWNQELTFDLPYSGLVSERALYLFEVIDEQPSLSMRTNLNNQGLSVYHKVAWGYLLPVGVDGLLNVGLPSLIPEPGEISATHRSESITEMPKPSSEPNTSRTRGESKSVAGKDLNVRLQLYQYRRYDGLVGVMQRSALQWPSLGEPYKSKDERSYPNDIPSIYLQWKLRQKNPIRNAFLKVAIGPRYAPVLVTEDEPAEGSDAGSDRVPGDDDNANAAKPTVGMLYKRRRRIKSKEDRFKLKSAALRRTRGPKDSCYVPDRLLYRLDVGPDGAMVVAYSNTGHLLAIASRAPRFNSLLNTTEIVYSLLLYDTDLDEEVWAEEIAHHAVIYDIKWSKNDRYLLTCSADGTCKVFDLVALHPLLALYPGQSVGITTTTDGTSPRATGEETSRTAGGTSVKAGGGGGGGHATDSSGPPSLRPNRIIRAFPPKIKHILSLPASVYVYSGVFQEFGPSLTLGSYFNPLGLSVNHNSPLATIGSGTLELSQWQEHMTALLQAPVPRVIVGAADGRIRVFDDAELTGYIRVVEPAEGKNAEPGDAVDFSPHDGCVNSLALDERTKYLISADSVGDVLVWRQDSQGWYQLLRKLRKEALGTAGAGATTGAVSTPVGGGGGGAAAGGDSMVGARGSLRRSMDLTSTLNRTKSVAASTTATTGAGGSKLKPREQFYDGSILSLAIHPDKMKGMMLVMSRQPSVLKVLNLATYKPFHVCENFAGLSSYLIREGDNVFSTGVFHRASFSADGKYIMTCSNVSQEVDRPVYKLLVWDSYTGEPVPSLLSQLTFAYPVRSVSWHPTQHLLAVAMLGPGAAVVLYSTDSTSVNNINQQQQQQQQQSPSPGYPGGMMDVAGSTNSLPRMDRSLNATGGLLPPSAFASESLLPRSASPNGSTSLSRGNSVRFSINGGENKDLLAYSLLNSQSFVNMRGAAAASDASEQSTPLLEMSRSNESLLPNMGTLQPSQTLLGGGATKPASSVLPGLNLSTIVEGKQIPPVTGGAGQPAAAAPSSPSPPISEAESRINKMARAREILARARAQRAAASAFADVAEK